MKKGILRGIFSLSILGMMIGLTACHKNVHTHEYDDGVITKEATCTEQGVKTFTCTGCEDSYTEPVPALGHIVKDDEAVAATCTTDGKTAGTHCERCNAIIVAQNTIPAFGHLFDTDWTHDDAQHWHAAICEHTNEKTAVADHTWDEGVINPEAGHTTTGTKTYTCTVCGATKTETLSATGHDVDLSWSKDGTRHWHTCSCGEILDAADHTWDEGTITTQATCTTDGVKTYKCKVCGYEKEETIAHEGHKLPETKEKINEVAPTCELDGSYDLVSRCTVCQEIVGTAEHKIVDALGHAYGDLIPSSEATCGHAGTIAHYECSVCHKFFNEQKEEVEKSAITIKQLDHQFGELVAKVDSDCLNTGFEEHYRCSSCNGYFVKTLDGFIEKTVEELTIPVIPHETTKTEGVEETCSTDGKLPYWYCSICEKYYEEETCTTEISDLTTWLEDYEGGKVKAHHFYKEVEELQPGYLTKGVHAHYECEKCDLLFSLDDKSEVTLESLQYDLDPISVEIEYTNDTLIYKDGLTVSDIIALWGEKPLEIESTNADTFSIDVTEDMISGVDNFEIGRHQIKITCLGFELDVHYDVSYEGIRIRDISGLNAGTTGTFTGVYMGYNAKGNNGNSTTESYYQYIFKDYSTNDLVITDNGFVLANMVKHGCYTFKGTVTKVGSGTAANSGIKWLTSISNTSLIATSTDPKVYQIDTEDPGIIDLTEQSQIKDLFKDGARDNNHYTIMRWSPFSTGLKYSANIWRVGFAAPNSGYANNYVAQYLSPVMKDTVMQYNCGIDLNTLFASGSNYGYYSGYTLYVVCVGGTGVYYLDMVVLGENCVVKYPSCDIFAAKVEAIPSTDTEDGQLEHYKCAKCNKLYWDAECTQEITDLLDLVDHNHDFHQVAVTETCTTDGYVEYYQCTRCQQKFYLVEDKFVRTSDETTIAKLGHDPDLENQVPQIDATNLTEGRKAYYPCGHEGCTAKFVYIAGELTEVDDAYLVIEKNPHYKKEGNPFTYVRVDDAWYRSYECAHCDEPNVILEAADEVVASIGENAYITLADAVAAVENNTAEPVTIKLEKSFAGNGVNIENKNIIFDFNSLTYTIEVEEGDAIGFVIKAGSVVVIQNGTLKNSSAEGVNTSRVLIQNFGATTVKDITVDASTTLDKDAQDRVFGAYAVSSSNGTVNFVNAEVVAKEGYVAIEVYFDETYADGTTVKVDATSKVTGRVEYGRNGGTAEDVAWAEKVVLDLSEATVANLDITLLNTWALASDLEYANIIFPAGIDCVYQDKLHAHTFVLFEAKDPTCTTAGYPEHYECSECGAWAIKVEENYIIVKQSEFEIAALGHVLEHRDAVAPGCETTGLVECYQCTRCNEYFKDEQGTEFGDGESAVIAAKGHSYTKYSFVEATSSNPVVAGDKIIVLTYQTTQALSINKNGNKRALVDFSLTNPDLTNVEVFTVRAGYKSGYLQFVQRNGYLMKASSTKLQWNQDNYDSATASHYDFQILYKNSNGQLYEYFSGRSSRDGTILHRASDGFSLSTGYNSFSKIYKFVKGSWTDTGSYITQSGYYTCNTCSCHLDKTGKVIA